MLAPAYQLYFERPRERILQENAAPLALEELLAIILGSGSSAGPVNQLAAELAVLLRTRPATPQLLSTIVGIGQAKAAAVLAALQLGPQLKKEQEELSLLSNPELIYQHCADIVARDQEWLVAFFLTSRQSLISRKVITVGTVSASLIHPREVFAPAIASGASALVLAHNHPSQVLTPSQADLTSTQQMVAAGEVLGIRLQDHLICGTEGYTSLRMACPQLFCYAQSV